MTRRTTSCVVVVLLLEGDGRIDVVAASETDNEVHWFKNNVGSWTHYTISDAAISAPRSDTTLCSPSR
jgi:hypothetical protein